MVQDPRCSRGQENGPQGHRCSAEQALWPGAWLVVADDHRRLRTGTRQAPGAREAEGFEVSSSKTIAASLASLYRAWTDAKLRKRWLAGATFSISKATPKKSVRIVWGRGPGRVEVMFYPRGAEKNQVTVQHGRLPTSAAAQRMQSYWKKRLEQLRGILEK